MIKPPGTVAIGDAAHHNILLVSIIDEDGNPAWMSPQTHATYSVKDVNIDTILYDPSKDPENDI